MGLFGPHWMKKRALYEELSDRDRIKFNSMSQSELYEVYKNAPSPDIRLHAVEKITDQELCKEIIKGSHSPEPRDFQECDAQEKMREAAAQSLTKKNLLDLAKTEYAALSYLKSESDLLTVAKETASIEIRDTAVYSITFQDNLEELVLFFYTKDTDLVRRCWMQLDLIHARDTARKLGILSRESCMKLGGHCNAPGDVTESIEENYDTGFIAHQRRICQMCGLPHSYRSKSTIVTVPWGNWEYMFDNDFRGVKVSEKANEYIYEKGRDVWHVKKKATDDVKDLPEDGNVK